MLFGHRGFQFQASLLRPRHHRRFHAYTLSAASTAPGRRMNEIRILIVAYRTSPLRQNRLMMLVLRLGLQPSDP